MEWFMVSRKRNVPALSLSRSSAHPASRRPRMDASTYPVPCDCQPLITHFCSSERISSRSEEHESVVISKYLKQKMQIQIEPLFHDKKPFSVLLLHLAQWASSSPSSHEAALFQRQCYHVKAGSSLLNQILAYIHQVLRLDDLLLIHTDVGAALIFTDVDEQGAHTISERVYAYLNLLEAEMLVPPLARETIISIGVASYPLPSSDAYHFYQQLGLMAHGVIVRPAITKQLRGVKPLPLSRTAYVREELPATMVSSQSPFMDLPSSLPSRLSQCLPIAMARELQCVPVGRNQYGLTIAMLDPTDVRVVARLHQYTGLTIFLVTCDKTALHLLLNAGW